MKEKYRLTLAAIDSNGEVHQQVVLKMKWNKKDSVSLKKLFGVDMKIELATCMCNEIKKSITPELVLELMNQN